MCYLSYSRLCVIGAVIVSFISFTDAACTGTGLFWGADGDTCYYKSPASSSEWRSRSEAAAYCASNQFGGTLATIADVREWQFINDYVIGPSDRSTDFWIGLMYIRPSPDTSASRRNRAHWYWIDSTTYIWQNWDSSGSDFEPTGEDSCVRLRMSSNGAWGDTFCYTPYRFICKRRDGITTKGATTTPVPTAPPSVPVSVAPVYTAPPSLPLSLPPSLPPSAPPTSYLPSQVITASPPPSSVSIFSVFGGSTVSASVVPQSKVPNISVYPGATTKKPVVTVKTTVKPTVKVTVTPPKTTTKATTPTPKTTPKTTKKTTTTIKPTTTTSKENALGVSAAQDELNLPLLIGVSVSAFVIIVATIVIGVVVLVKKRNKNPDDGSSEGATNHAFHAGERPSVRGREPERLPTWLEEKEEDSPPPPPAFPLDDTGLI